METELTIGALSARSGVAPSALRYYERLSASWRPRLDAQIALLERLRDRLEGCIGCGCLSMAACRLFNPGDAAAARGTGPRRLLEPD
jgi:MerR family redox-sensitive transcriptional activator SoxR